MTRWFVTRHQGAKEWAETQGIKIDRQVNHLDSELIKSGDEIFGSLPINIVAELNAKGARYFHLSLPLTAEQRGQEISATLMTALGAKLEEFNVTKVGGKDV